MTDRIPKLGDVVLVNVSSRSYKYSEGRIVKLAEDKRGEISRVLVKYESWIGTEAQKWESVCGLEYVGHEKF